MLSPIKVLDDVRLLVTNFSLAGEVVEGRVSSGVHLTANGVSFFSPAVNEANVEFFVVLASELSKLGHDVLGPLEPSHIKSHEPRLIVHLSCFSSVNVVDELAEGFIVEQLRLVLVC